MLIAPEILEKSPVFNGVIISITLFIEILVSPPLRRLPAFNKYSREPNLGILPSFTLNVVFHTIVKTFTDARKFYITCQISIHLIIKVK